LDVAEKKYSEPIGVLEQPACSELDPNMILKAVDLLTTAKAPLILAGGGAKWAVSPLRELAETLGAPVVQTVNARGLMYGHPLGVPASPSLKAVRRLIESSDVVLAIGTELGQTDFDMFATGTMATMPSLIRIDLCPEQLVRHEATLAIVGDAIEVVEVLLAGLEGYTPTDVGAMRAEAARIEAFEEIGPEMRALCDFLQALREAVPNALMVGDSVYPIYAGNLYYDHDRPGGWFNAATGFGALGYGIPAAIGAAIAEPDAPVICIIGDGGAQFSLPEMMCAVDEKLSITFLIWNNFGYQEIATSMQAVGVSVIGCDPTPPDFEHIARSCGMQFWRIDADLEAVTEALKLAKNHDGPRLIEVRAPNISHSTD
jgi:acetolactate synthase-1/2/3 large subunit